MMVFLKLLLILASLILPCGTEAFHSWRLFLIASQISFLNAWDFRLAIIVGDELIFVICLENYREVLLNSAFTRLL